MIEQFNRAGAVNLGKTNMDEFAMGSSNETSFFGKVKNPWDVSAVPGGSSGGSAAAVAARLAPAATGTDTGGSIRQPAALTGITGIKPTYGTVSRYGMIAFASSLDQGGPMAKSAEDCALMLNVMAGFDSRDSTSLERDKEDYTRDLEQPLQGPENRPAQGVFRRRLVRRRGPGGGSRARRIPQARCRNRRNQPAQHAPLHPGVLRAGTGGGRSNLARFDGVRYGYRAPEYGDLADMYQKTRAQGFGTEVKRRIMIGTYVLSAGYYDAYYIKAQKLRRLIAQDFEQAFKQCDVIMGPTAPTTAFKLGEKSDDPVSMYLSDIYTIAVNLAGLPGMSVPCGFGDNGLPVGLQIVGNYFAEAKMLNVAHQYQLATDWHHAHAGRDLNMQWEVVIGLETHAQLNTVSKIFSGAATAYGAEPNTQACAVDIALPGVLPVFNRAAAEKAVKFGLAIGARINRKSVFERKNYFYPDLPKGYQISQLELPIVAEGGTLRIQAAAGRLRKRHPHHPRPPGRRRRQIAA